SFRRTLAWCSPRSAGRRSRHSSRLVLCQAELPPARPAARWTLTFVPALWLVLLLRARAELHADGCALEAEGVAQPVLEVPLVGEVQQRGVVDEEDKGGRIHLSLGGIVDMQHSSLDMGGMVALQGGLDHLIEARRGNALLADIIAAQ